MKALSLLVGLASSLLTFSPVYAQTKEVEVRFNPGNSCGDYSVRSEDTLSLRASKGQYMVITPLYNIQLTAIFKGGTYLTTNSELELTSSGKYLVSSLPYDWSQRMGIRICILNEDRD